jgi:septal ring factor EnvC (AmiA/AmiB activator)
MKTPRNLGEQLEELDGLKDKAFTILGIEMTPATIAAAVALLSTICGGLYGGFLMYQKVEAVAGMDLGAYQQQMEVMDAKVQEALDYARDIKNGLKDDIIQLEKQVDRAEDAVRTNEEKVRTLIDDAEKRFETRRDQLRMSQDQDMKELEDRLNAKMQRALDNPLAQ